MTNLSRREGKREAGWLSAVGCQLFWNCEIEPEIGVGVGVVLAGVLCVSGREMTAHELETWKRAYGAIECHAMPYNLKKLLEF
jgi:hypothetical protein